MHSFEFNGWFLSRHPLIYPEMCIAFIKKVTDHVSSLLLKLRYSLMAKNMTLIKELKRCLQNGAGVEVDEQIKIGPKSLHIRHLFGRGYHPSGAKEGALT